MLGNFTQPICVPEPPTAAPTSPSCDSDPAATGGLLAVERHPLKNDAFSEDREAMKRTLRKHNEIWGAMESPVVSSNVQLSDDDDQTETFNNSACDRKNNTNNIKKWVQFSSPEHWDSWYEHPDEVAVLRESRKNDMLQRRADKERMERLIRPIMTKEHREKIFQKLYGAVDKEEETSLKID